MNLARQRGGDSSAPLLESQHSSCERRAIVEDLWNWRLACPLVKQHHIYQETLYASLGPLVSAGRTLEKHRGRIHTIDSTIWSIEEHRMTASWLPCCGFAPPPLPDGFVYLVLFDSGLPWEEAVLALGDLSTESSLSRNTSSTNSYWNRSQRYHRLWSAPLTNAALRSSRLPKAEWASNASPPVIVPPHLCAVLLEQAVAHLTRTCSESEAQVAITDAHLASNPIKGSPELPTEPTASSQSPSNQPERVVIDERSGQCTPRSMNTLMMPRVLKSHETDSKTHRRTPVSKRETSTGRISSAPIQQTELRTNQEKDLRRLDRNDAQGTSLTWTGDVAISTLRPNSVLARQVAGLPSLLARSVLVRLIATRQLTLPILHLFQGIEMRSLSLKPCRAQVTDAWMPPIGTFVALEELDLSYCTRLSDQGIRFLALRNGSAEDASTVSAGLKALSLRGCRQLTNAAVVNLGLFPQLERIDLSDCTGLGNAALQYLAERFPFQLKALSLARCERVGSSSIAALFGSSESAGRTASRHALMGEKPAMSELPIETSTCRLEFLDVSGCPAVGEYAFVGPGQQLDTHGSLVTSDEASSALSVLRLRGCVRVNDTVCEHIGTMHPNLQELDLYGCSRVTDRGIMDLVKNLAHSLTALCLTETQITDQGLVVLGQVRGLRRLHLTRCRHLQLNPGVMHDFCARMAAQGTLSELRLRSLSSVNGRVLAEMSNLFLHGSLTHLNLTDCRKVDDEALLALSAALKAQFTEARGQLAAWMREDYVDAHERPACCLVRSLSLRNTAICDAGLVLKVFGGVRHLDLAECTRLDNLEGLFHGIAEQEEAVQRMGRRWMRRHCQQEHEQETEHPSSFKPGSSSRIAVQARVEEDTALDGVAVSSRTQQRTSIGARRMWSVSSSNRDEHIAPHGQRLTTYGRILGIPSPGPWLNTLEYLDLSQCQTLSFANLRTLRSESLRILILDHCSGVTNACVALLAYHVPNLQELSLRFTAVGDLGIAAFANRLGHLEKLHLRGLPDVTHVGLRRLAASPLASKLRVLELAECTSIGELALTALNGFKALEYLSLKGCSEVNDGALRCLQHVPALAVLNLRQCPLISAKQIELLRRRLPSLAEIKWCGESTVLGEHSRAPTALVDSFLAYVHGGSRAVQTTPESVSSRRRRREPGPSPTRVFLDMFDAWEMRQRSPRRNGTHR
ncbi:hypothetical protein CCYA_CCYA04G1324 [Cyanidiococcus yangmingshanensis]|nr:hypothetical protein CCYA_CCYA04G1324 [Cyanidiococcus yangmingshanensis]